MSTVLEPTVVAKPKGRPRKSERDDAAVKVDRAIVEMAKAVARTQGIPVAEFLSDLLAVPVRKAYLDTIRDLDKLK